jgi:hypothetical protein
VNKGRDPWGWVAQEAGQWYRYLTSAGYKAYTESFPLQEELAQQKRWWVGGPPSLVEEGLYRAPLPTLSCLTYPWEWSWTDWKEAALTTLAIQKYALQKGYTLRDATPLNLTLEKGHMRWFDQLSLAPHKEGQPWKAYPEFIRTFLAPLLLMAWRDRRLGELLRLYPNGLPIDLVYELLPTWRRWHPTALIHLRLPLRARPTQPPKTPQPSPTLPTKRLIALIESLENDIAGLSPRYTPSPWEKYETDCPYPPEAQAHKKQVIESWLSRIGTFRWAADIGAYQGTYTRLLLSLAQEGVVALERDLAALDTLAATLAPKHPHLYPIAADIAHPTPTTPWSGGSLLGLYERLHQKFAVVLSLALTHHLRLKSFMSFSAQGKLLASLIAPEGYLIIEYVPPSDKQVQFLHGDPTLFPDYSEEGFIQSFQDDFTLEAQKRIESMDRVLYLMRKK